MTCFFIFVYVQLSKLKEIQQYSWLPSQFCVNFTFSFSWIWLYYNKLILNEQSSLETFLFHFAKRSCSEQDYTSDGITPDTNAISYLNELWFSKLRAFRAYYMTLFCYPWHLSKSQGFFPPLCFRYNMCGVSPVLLENSKWIMWLLKQKASTRNCFLLCVHGYFKQFTELMTCSL